ncbi:MAG TPA: S28 family serine protease [Myxococcus sp.]|nr:S28 family serine protease [Myxococcus sp.]
MSAFTRRSGPLACALVASLLLACGDVQPVPGADVLERLEAIPGLEVVEPTGMDVPPGYRFFILSFAQPADHANPGGEGFSQRMTLLYTSDVAPMVLHTGGYSVSEEPRQRELTQLLKANQLSVEHRYFGPSTPQGDDGWRHLTIQQSASDFHRIVEAFKPHFPGRWLSTGGSKGGETVVFFRRFYPEDVDATVAYVAPITRYDDERFIAFQESVGDAGCRDKLKAFQRAVLTRRQAMLARMADLRNTTFSHVDPSKALEHAVIEYYFYFWQYQQPSRCGRIPSATATDDVLFRELDEVVGLWSFSDGAVESYGPYFHQAAHELGYPRPFESHLADLLQYPGTDVPESYIPRGITTTFRPEAMPDIQDWVATRGERLMFIYGALDPWSAAPYTLGDARDAYLYTVPGGNHGARISQLPEPQRGEALRTVFGWAGMAPDWMGVRAQSWTLEPEGEEFSPRGPPRSLTAR